MISPADIAERLSVLVGSKLKFVGLAGDFASAADQLKASPSAFVLPAARRPGPNMAGTDLVSQRVTVQYTVVIMFTRAGAAGADQLNRVQDVEDAVIDRIVGWEPDGFISPFVYQGGRMVALDINEGVIFWASEFSASYLLRKG